MLASLTMPVLRALSLSRHRGGDPDSCRAEAIAIQRSPPWESPHRRSRPAKCSCSRVSSSAVGRRAGRFGLPISRSRAGSPGLRDDFGVTGIRTLLAALRTTPIQIRSLITAAGPAPPHDATRYDDQVGGRQGVGNRLAERMSFEELQMGRLAPLPARNRLEGVDVPVGFSSARVGVALPQPGQLSRILECHFAVPGPAQCGRAVL